MKGGRWLRAGPLSRASLLRVCQRKALPPPPLPPSAEKVKPCSTGTMAGIGNIVPIWVSNEWDWVGRSSGRGLLRPNERPTPS